jgi:hypothetical protein
MPRLSLDQIAKRETGKTLPELLEQGFVERWSPERLAETLSCTPAALGPYLSQHGYRVRRLLDRPNR